MLYLVGIMACGYYLDYPKEEYWRCSFWSQLESAGIGPIYVDQPMDAIRNSSVAVVSSGSAGIGPIDVD